VTEKTLQKNILAAMRKRGFWFPVTSGGYMQPGLPDLIGCVDGLFIGLEVKLPGEPHPLTRLQAETLNLIRSADGAAFVVHSVEEAEAAVDEALAGRGV